MNETVQTYSDALRLAAQKLARADVEGPLRDARRLMELAAGMSTTDLIAEENTQIPLQISAKFSAFIQRRLEGEPISRIAGRREFWGLEFVITSDVLDPRPDTETLVELVLSEWKSDYKNVLDLGTGSGCILLSILSEKLSAQGLGLDQSEKALGVATKNAEKLELKQRARFQNSNWFDALTPEQKFDVIVSNPPYIPSADIEVLDIDVKKYDPLSALDGGEDGYDDYRHIISKAKVHLNKNGLIAFEVGFNQAEKVCELLENEKFIHINVRKDLSGVKRCVYGYASSV
ncbi:peptide chain release factor N(5)-glutamine methyltransferase [Hirschia baltica]|uniref:Release factor glutamine methyltransferase n=1 Tax=Hirschia baltica (strain ATCC 49814 / DSM 5838 / IFAM 1418) TaxID=582402 RepID=C6XPZ2_HIRBI|nr:peptide chain release factor N(5)-glutamine methyltransferase [Hirschia baltica]ACT58509.1 modification methylase, HemK family [Hirschia baltica ATCC 49814]